MNSNKNLSACPTKHTEDSSNSIDFQDNLGLFTFSKQLLNPSHKDLPKKTPYLQDSSPVLSKSFQMKNLEIENQILSEKIKSIEIEIKNSVFEDSSLLMHHIQKTQKKIESLKERLEIENSGQEILSKKQSEFDQIKSLSTENAELSKKIALLKENIKLKEKTKVPKDRSLKLAGALAKLEEDQNSCLQLNQRLKEELEYLKSLNYSKSCSLLSIEDQDKLFMIFLEIHRMLSISQKISKGEQVRLKEFIDYPLGVSKLTPAQLLTEIKETTKKLKENISDIYADHCGDACQVI